MMEKFIQQLQQRLPLDQAAQRLLQQLLPIQHFAKGEFLLRQDQRATAFHFNLSGFVRLFYLKNGEERTAYFYPEGTFISAYESFVHQVPATFYLQATEDTQVVVISQEASVKLLAHSESFATLARIVMEEELIANQRIISNLLTLSPEERYQQLLEEQPEIFSRVAQRHIASYIGVLPESLSRIKKRALERKS